jgi:NADH dehydrogenase FAD-containing subunit
MDYRSSFPRFKKQLPCQRGCTLLMLPDEKNPSTSLISINAMISYTIHWQPFHEKLSLKLEQVMNREEMISRILDRTEPWDILVVGGGASGVGIAVDSAARGYDLLLLEQSDFGKRTSSRSTKLVHGGVRYLQQGNIALVMEVLKERGILRKNAHTAMQVAPKVASLMAAELEKNGRWQSEQAESFRRMGERYLPGR